METPFSGKIKLGVLGGGQLGKMLIYEAARYDLEIHILDPDENAPATVYAHHSTKGNFRDYQTVMDFGKKLDVITIEIEDVNTDALRDLEAEGKRVFPQADVIELIRDKTLQKAFYREHNLPTSKFEVCSVKPAESPLPFPCVWKAATGGYDGRGVVIIRDREDFENLPQDTCLFEEMVDIDREIGVIVARNADGELRVFPPVEMEFHPEANQVELVVSPTSLPPEADKEAIELASRIAETFGIVGTLAVEFFYTKDKKWLINEVAPRVHNSGHLTIEGAYTSQFEQHLRAILNLPLGDPSMIMPAAMGNLVGEEGFSGPVHYEGTEELMRSAGVYLHLYGKKETRPFRKMGHLTAIHKDREEARKLATSARANFKITSR